MARDGIGVSRRELLRRSLGAGVFLAGLELMVTAVALPSILADLADPSAGSAWVELRKASWIINGYLLVYILTMPMAGRLADLWGVRRLFMGALSVFIVGSSKHKTSRATCCASGSASGAATTPTIRPASATARRSPASPIPGGMAR